jgi:hypothetical protein
LLRKYGAGGIGVECMKHSFCERLQKQRKTEAGWKRKSSQRHSDTHKSHLVNVSVRNVNVVKGFLILELIPNLHKPYDVIRGS